MMEIIKPTSQQHWLALRTMDVTSTETAALFGLSPYTTEFELWHRKKDAVVVTIDENERMKWGTRLQDSIALGIAQDENWEVRRMDEYIRDPELRLGASFDFSIEKFVPHMEIPEHEKGLLEIKNVDSLVARDSWPCDEEGNIEAPHHIEIQVQQQLAITGRASVHIGALVGGNRVLLLERRPDPDVIAAIKQKVAAFWKSIEENRPPRPDFIRDADFIASLYGYADAGKILDFRDDQEFTDLALQHKELGEEIKGLEEMRAGVKSKMLMAMLDAEKIIGDGFTITAGMVSEAEVAFTRKPYRMFKPNWPRAKK
jgi:putative phage-type endonuclease